jgi:hypothetical protein
VPDTANFAITYPCETDLINCTAFTTFAYDVEDALVSVNATATKARLRPAATVRYLVSTPYTAGVAVIPTLGLVAVDTDNMFSAATPTVLTVNTPGTYLITFVSSTNMASTNTSHKAEILVNGVSTAQVKSGVGIAGPQPPSPLTCSVLAPLLTAGNTISCRVTVTGVGNDSTFPLLSAALVSYGGS